MSKADDKATTVKPARKRAQFRIFEVVSVADISEVEITDHTTVEDVQIGVVEFPAWIPVDHPVFETSSEAKNWRDDNCVDGVYPIVKVMSAKRYTSVKSVKSEAVEV